MNTYIKNFKNFESGISELLELVPDLKYYTGESFDQRKVTHALLDVIKEDIPNMSENTYPNTFALKIDEDKVEFRTDLGYAFTWLKNPNSDNPYEFKISFTHIPRSRKSMIEELVSNGWEENEERSNYIARVPSKKENIVQEEFPSHESDDVQELQVENVKDYSQTLPIPTFDQVDEPIEEDDKNQIQEEEIEEDSDFSFRFANVTKEEPEDNEENDDDDKEDFVPQNKPLKKGLLGRSLNRNFRKPNLQENNKIVETQIEVEEPRQMVLPDGTITEETKNLSNTNTGFIDLDPRMFNIRPTDKPYNVIITFEGREMPLNVNEQKRGIIRDPANKKLIIEQVVYDYKEFKVFGLPDNYKPDQATYVESDTAPIDQYGSLPDEAFVPRETIMKNSTIDIDEIQEEAMRRENFKSKLSGIKSNPTWNREKNRPIIPQNNNSVLKRGRSFVIDRQPSQYPSNTGYQQSVRIRNDENPGNER